MQNQRVRFVEQLPGYVLVLCIVEKRRRVWELQARQVGNRRCLWYPARVEGGLVAFDDN